MIDRLHDRRTADCLRCRMHALRSLLPWTCQVAARRNRGHALPAAGVPVGDYAGSRRLKRTAASLMATVSAMLMVRFTTSATSMALSKR